MCEYCEPRYDENLGDVALIPLPAVPGYESVGDDLVLHENRYDGTWEIINVCYPPSVAGPINYCPMCGRKMKGAEQ